MNPAKHTPIYNLKAVVQETGIKPDTLRAWERRYELPKPQRTASGHRLYSQNDIDMLHWLMARQHEGLSISRAIELWQHMQHEERNGVPGNNGTTPAPLPLAQKQASSTGVFNHTPNHIIVDLTEQWVKACIDFDQFLADQILAQAFALFPTETVCTKLIQSGLAQIGDGWFRGTITVQQEHFASTIAMRRLETMLAATPLATRSGRIMIGNPPAEEHTFAPLMLSLLLRRRGWDVVYLGANIPLISLDATIKSMKPHLVILTAQQLHTAANLFDMSQTLLQERTPLAFGGLIFNQIPEATKLIPGYFLGENLEDALKVVEEIMTSLRVKLAQQIVRQEYRTGLLHFQQRRAQIEAELWNRSAQLGFVQRDLDATNEKMASALFAALQLGNIQYIEPSINWLENILINHLHLQVETVAGYLDAYASALHNNMDQRGLFIAQWFAVMYKTGRR